MYESFSPDGSEVLAIGTCDEIFAGRRFRDLPRTRALGEEHSAVVARNLGRILRYNAGMAVDRESAFLREMRDDDLTELAAQIARKGDRSLTTSDFAEAFSNSLSEILVENYVIEDQLAGVVGDLTVPDFKETKITELQMPPLSDEPEPEDGPVVFFQTDVIQRHHGTGAKLFEQNAIQPVIVGVKWRGSHKSHCELWPGTSSA